MSKRNNRRSSRNDAKLVPITKEVTEILEGLPDEKKNEINALLIKQVSKSYSGPVPSPEMMYYYDQVAPGMSNRLVSLVEGEKTHRQKYEMRELNYGMIISIIGLVFTFVVVAVLIFVAYKFAIQGMEGLAAGVIGIVVAAGGLFAYKNFGALKK